MSVHYLANVVLIERLLGDGTLRAGRVITVSSESHRSADAIDFDGFGAFHHYGLVGAMRQYAAP